MTDPCFLTPDWPIPSRIKAAVTTRTGGYSQGAFGTLNLADHVGDDSRTVARNRALIQTSLGMPGAPKWMTQVHGSECIVVDHNTGRVGQGDSAWTDCDDVVLAIMVADCLPLFLAGRSGEEIAVVHAGWRGLAAGVIESAAEQFNRNDLIAWLGPAIGPCHYEVDRSVKDALRDDAGFLPGRDECHWMLDLYAAARKRLVDAGVVEVLGGGFCTYCDSNRFFSYRRDGETGRMAALIWKTS